MKNVDRLRNQLEILEHSFKELERCLKAMGLPLDRPRDTTESTYLIRVKQYCERLVREYDILDKYTPGPQRKRPTDEDVRQHYQDMGNTLLDTDPDGPKKVLRANVTQALIDVRSFVGLWAAEQPVEQLEAILDEIVVPAEWIRTAEK